jgi:hypothetical protein
MRLLAAAGAGCMWASSASAAGSSVPKPAAAAAKGEANAAAACWLLRRRRRLPARRATAGGGAAAAGVKCGRLGAAAAAAARRCGCTTGVEGPSGWAVGAGGRALVPSTVDPPSRGSCCEAFSSAAAAAPAAPAAPLPPLPPLPLPPWLPSSAVAEPGEHCSCPAAGNSSPPRSRLWELSRGAGSREARSRTSTSVPPCGGSEAQGKLVPGSVPVFRCGCVQERA